ncbi:MAG TPA: YopJ family acetyltransferase [Arsenophonus nasoniae]|uniref:YopJ family acetyltransferase n=1 Tax=Arsenophonus nasoniae TaxID=638 RepID=UPI003879A601
MLSPTASIKTDNIAQEDNKTVIKIDKTLLCKYISDIEQSLKDGTWATKNFSIIDKELLPPMVKLANEKKEGLNLKYLTSPDKLYDEIFKIKNNDIKSSRYIINVGEKDTHFGVIDTRLIEGKISILLFEPASLTNSMSSSILAFRTKLAIEKCGLKNIIFSIIEMDIQRSKYECAIFSLSLGKKLAKESDSINIIHKLNIENKLDEEMINKKADPILPPELFKHTQGVNRIKDYISVKPEIGNKIINKKGQNIVNRQKDNLEKINERFISKSIYNKRLDEYKKLITDNFEANQLPHE